MAGYDMDGFFDLQPPKVDGYQPVPPSQPGAPYQPGAPSQPNCPPQSACYYYIAAKECRLVLDIDGGMVAPMTKVILWEQKEPSEAENQLWFNDTPTGSIRSKSDPSLALEMINDILHVNTYQQGNPMQLWEGSDQFIRNRMNPTQVFQTTGMDFCCEITTAQANFTPPQHFEPIFINNPPPPSQPSQPSPYPDPFTNPNVTPQNNQRRPFFLVSQMHGKVMDIKGADPSEGAKVIAYHRQADAPPNQLWYWDDQGLLHSAFNDLVPTASGLATQLRMYKFTGGVSQRFKLEGNKITNGAGEVVDIRGGRKWDGTEIITYSYNGDSNQHWSVEYV